MSQDWTDQYQLKQSKKDIYTKIIEWSYISDGGESVGEARKEFCEKLRKLLEIDNE